MYLLYSLVTGIVFVLASPYFFYQALRHNKYVGSIGQRLGYLPISFNLDGDESIWVHAVSVGEVLSARPLISELRARYPKLRLFRRRRSAARSSRATACRTSTPCSISRSTGRSPRAGPSMSSGRVCSS